MDIGDLLLLLFLLFPLLSRLLRKKTPKPVRLPQNAEREPRGRQLVKPGQGSGSRPAAEDEDPFARAIREIQEALTATGTPPHEPEELGTAAPTHPSPSPYFDRDSASPVATPETEFVSPRETAWKEDLFESDEWTALEPPQQPNSAWEPDTEDTAAPSGHRQAVHPIAAVLRDPGKAREAILMAEILRPPLSLRRGRL